MIPTREVQINNFLQMRPTSRNINHSSTNNHTSNRKIRTSQKQRNVKIFPLTLNNSQMLLLKRSDKMKLVYWNCEEMENKLPFVVVSADFVVNQDNFW